MTQLPERLQEIIDDFAALEGQEKLEYLMELSEQLPPLPEWLAARRDEMDMVHECMTTVFVPVSYTHLDVYKRQAPASSTDALTRWVEIAGIVVFGLGLFLVVRAMRPHIDGYPEFDLIILYVTLVLPLASPLLVRVAGYNPVDYSINTCVLDGQETMNAVAVFTARLGNPTCISAFLSSAAMKPVAFLLAALLVSVLVGLWWDRRRWPPLALAYTVVFLFFFTAIFTNLNGWRTGAIGSLGYWLEQHGVQRGAASRA